MIGIIPASNNDMSQAITIIFQIRRAKTFLRCQIGLYIEMNLSNAIITNSKILEDAENINVVFDVAYIKLSSLFSKICKSKNIILRLERQRWYNLQYRPRLDS